MSAVEPDAAAAAQQDAMARVTAAARAQMSDPAIASMAKGEFVATAVGIADTLESIERGETAATPVQRAYLSGALAALRAVLIAEQSS